MIATLQQMSLPSDQDASGRTLGEEEIAAVTEVIRSGTLTSTKGPFVGRFESAFASLMGVRHAIACASGTAAVHAALAAVDLRPGDEVLTTAITDMGALAPILYQGAVPVFADVDPLTFNVSSESIAERLTTRTRAIIATHLFGNPADMTAIMQIADAAGVPVIEDCAQAYCAQHHGKSVGTFGSLACYSLQQGKHITTGEGGIVTTDDDRLARRVRLFVNKAWGYGDRDPDHYFLALNYRMTELQGAVGHAQLPKLVPSVCRRIARAQELTARLRDLAGVTCPQSRAGDVHVYWKYPLRVDSRTISGGAVAMGERLAKRGIASAPRYIKKPAFECEIFARRRTFGQSEYPFTLATPEAVDYRAERFPGTFDALRSVLVLPWSECYTEEHVEYLAGAISEAAVGG